MKNRTLFIVGLICMWVISVYIYSFQNGWQSHDLLRSALFILGEITIIVSGIFTVIKYGLGNITGKTVLILIIGFFLWMIGSTTYSINTFVLGIDEYPSLADLFILTGYFFILAGLLHEIVQRKVSFRTPYKLALLAIGFVIGVVIFYFGFYLAIDPTASWFVNFVSVAYGVWDLILLMTLIVVLMMAVEYRGGKMFLPWLAIFIGMIVQLVADIFFTFFYVQYGEQLWPYYEGIDILWITAYLFFAYGLLSFGLIVKDAQHAIAGKLAVESKSKK
ncbi:MAG: hypothetical protein HZC02_01790 [Candidatus Levybacteria bacterium]|nr:hypothetical protein [Candidatus Levybacteria bacterium]